MKNRKKALRVLSVFIFSLGVLLGIALIGGLSWPNLEAAFYFGGVKLAEESFKTLQCPQVITSSEVGNVTATLTNRHAKSIDPLIRVEVSESDVMTRKVEMRPVIDPGTTEQVKWTITSDDMVFGSAILVKAFQLPTYKTPSREGTCGTLVVDLPFLSGSQVLGLAALICLLCLGGGITLMLAIQPPTRDNPLRASNAMLCLSGIILVGSILSYLGMWVFGLLTLVVAVLLIFILVMNIVKSYWQTETVFVAA